MYFQSDMWFIGRIMSWPNTIWTEILPLFPWYVERTPKVAISRIPIQGPKSYTYVLCRSCSYKVPWYLMYSLYGCVRLWVPSGIWISLNSVFLFYQDILKLVTEEFFCSVIHDFYYSWIPDHPRSFGQVSYYHHFIVSVLCYFKPPSYGFYPCNSFLILEALSLFYIFYRCL